MPAHPKNPDAVARRTAIRELLADLTKTGPRPVRSAELRAAAELVHLNLVRVSDTDDGRILIEVAKPP